MPGAYKADIQKTHKIELKIICTDKATYMFSLSHNFMLSITLVQFLRKTFR